MSETMFVCRRWAVQEAAVTHPCAVPTVYHFATERERADWLAQNPTRRRPVGKRHPLVKAYRQRASGGRTNV